MSAIEVWMRGPVEGVARELQPVAHAILQVIEDLEALAGDLPEALVEERPGGAASIGFHVRHIAGSTDRLLTYAEGHKLSPEQFAWLKAEATATTTPFASAVADTVATLRTALARVQATPLDQLYETRKIGRAELPTTTFGLLFHAAEHATRHAGQAVTTAKILRGREG